MVKASVQSDIKDPGLAKEGVLKVEWAAREMPVLRILRERFAKDKPLKGLRVSGCLHVTTETANLAITLREAGAEVALCASNPLSTQDDVAAALVREWGIATFAIKGEDVNTYYKHVRQALEQRPNITLDDGADLVTALHTDQQALRENVIGGTEETTTGVIRLKSMAREGKLRYPIVAVNDAETKHLFDNRYGTGQSTLDGIIRATNVLLAAKNVVVAGYGWCGRGVASRARGMGSQVIVTEINPIRALEAVMDGFRVMPMDDAARIGDIFITVTGNSRVVDKRHLETMKDGAILANSGHFNVEINIEALEAMTETKRTMRSMVEEYRLMDGRRLYLLGEGRLINLAAAEGHPSSVMDMSFANQALAVTYLATEARSLKPDVYPVPADMDMEIGRLKLQSMGIALDTLSQDQQRYLSSWQQGT
ncbi:MAG: adenosylhomocysteinase [Dehalococcoidia bacterium]|nr:adenosylhomocysteinase [Dehalococcoidia bacterium]